MGVEIFTQQHKFHGHFVGNARDSAGNQAASEPQLGFGIFEARIVRGNNQVAHLYDDVGASDTPPFDRRNNGLICLRSNAWYALPHFFWRVFYISANREGLVASGCEYPNAVIAVFQPTPSGLQRKNHLLVQRVHSIRTVDGNGRDAIVRSVGNQFSHSVLRCHNACQWPMIDDQVSRSLMRK